MNEFITLKPMQTGGYKVLEMVDSRFYSLYEVLEYHFYQTKFSSANLMDWLMDDKKTGEGNEWVYIRKEKGVIALYDTSDLMSDPTISFSEPNPMKRFEMSIQNFAAIIAQWEELRVSRPDIILIVIHEDNHVSLETDPVIITAYQDAGYAFDSNKVPRGMKEYACFEKWDNHLDYSGLKSVFSQLNLLQSFISMTFFPDRPSITKLSSIYKYHDQENDTLYIGYYDELFGRYVEKIVIPPLEELGKYVQEQNSCKISLKNFIEFEEKWLVIENSDAPFALMYRDYNDWVYCKDFSSKEEMYNFMIQYQHIQV